MTFHMPCVTCHLSHVTCRMSHVMCHISCIICHMSLTRSPNLSPNKKLHQGDKPKDTQTQKHKTTQTEIATYRLNPQTIRFPKIKYMGQLFEDGGK